MSTARKAVPDCFDVMTNNKRMTRSEIRGFQLDFNVNLNAEDDGDEWLDQEFIETQMPEIDEAEFISKWVLNDVD